MRLVLRDGMRDIEASEEDKFEFVIKTASGKLSFEEIKSWLKENLK